MLGVQKTWKKIWNIANPKKLSRVFQHFTLNWNKKEKSELGFKAGIIKTKSLFWLETKLYKLERILMYIIDLKSA